MGDTQWCSSENWGYTRSRAFGCAGFHADVDSGCVWRQLISDQMTGGHKPSGAQQTTPGWCGGHWKTKKESSSHAVGCTGGAGDVCVCVLCVFFNVSFIWCLHGKCCVVQTIRMSKSLDVALVGREARQPKCGSAGGLWRGLRAADWLLVIKWLQDQTAVELGPLVVVLF